MSIKVFVAQSNYVVGDIKKNCQKMIQSIHQAKKNECDVIVFSEMAITGYPPMDLLYYDTFYETMHHALLEIAKEAKEITALVGAFRKNEQRGNDFYNCCFVIQDQKITGYYDKQLLPNYDVFNERRYFTPGDKVKIIQVNHVSIALSICEDLWVNALEDLYQKNPIDELKKHSFDLLINLSASPFQLEKLDQRFKIAQEVSKTFNCPIVYCNQVGANDSLVFDGYSFIAQNGHILNVAKGFEEDQLILDLKNLKPTTHLKYDPLEQLYKALTLGIRDYFAKQNFKKALIGISGGIDSALVAALTVEAIGPHNVIGISMPSRYSSEHSVKDAKRLADSLGMKLIEIPIEQVHKSYLNLLAPQFKGLNEDATEENLQSRIRGMLLMALSNKWGHLVISCGNKSELAVGYATLYGDLTGGLAAISDLTKTQVYKLANWINSKSEIIPGQIISKDPSAELRPEQKDTDTLPDYEALDQIITEFVERHLGAKQIAQKHQIDLSIVQEIISKIHRSEYKRRQSPMGLKVTQRAFSYGRQLPIVHHFQL